MKNQERNLTQELTDMKMAQHAIEFAKWVTTQGKGWKWNLHKNFSRERYEHYTNTRAGGTYREFISPEELYQQFLSYGLTDVELFRERLVKHIYDLVNDMVLHSIKSILDDNRNFNIPTETAEELTENNSL